MRSFLLGAPVEGAFNIPFKVERGDSMKTVKVTIGNASSNMYLWAVEIERLAAAAGVKNGIVWYSGPDTGRYNLPAVCTLVNSSVMCKLNGSVVGASQSYSAYRVRTTPQLASVGTNWDADSRVGDEYTIAVVDCPWFE